ncbi:inositol hexaphosphate kinase 1 [Aphelenchoides avenae]|nr:inositol hexaphosphate kinase 1 [Aphelenchus avenae]
MRPNCSSTSLLPLLPVDCATENPGEVLTLMRPYKHQVGGHTVIFSVDDEHVCKPRNTGESRFYQNVPEKLKPWTAKYCFEAELFYDETVGAYAVEILADGAQCSHSSPRANEAGKSRWSLRERDDVFRDVDSGVCSELNPWALHCQLRALSREACKRYVVLENITARFIRPCVLDLKLGTRQYGDEASEEKKQHQRRKCAKSTSKELGVRLCGLQYYDALTGTYQCSDKYYGRSLSRSGLQKWLARFFYDASGKLRSSVCRTVLTKLRELRATIAEVDGLRLFGSSLLIVVEGAAQESMSERTDVRLIDFAHAVLPDEKENVQANAHTGPDEGCLLGIDSLILMLNSLLTS